MQSKVMPANRKQDIESPINLGLVSIKTTTNVITGTARYEL
jgi:hypothetical protein